MSRIIYCLLGVVLMFVSCSDDTPGEVDIPAGYPGDIVLSSQSPYVTIFPGGSAASVEFRSFEGNAVVSVAASDRGWRIEGDRPEWLSVERNGENVVLSAYPNSAAERRSATVKIVAGEGAVSSRATLEVEQRGFGAADIAVDRDKVFMTAGGQFPQSVKVITSNDQWYVETASTWLLAEQTETGLNLVADPNPNIEERETIIDVVAKSADGSVQDAVSILVVQDSKAYLNFDVTNFSYTEEGGEGEIEVESNQRTWEIVNEFDWLEIEKTGENSLKFKVRASSEIDDRIGMVAATAGELDNIVRQNATVYQMGTDSDKMIFEYKTNVENQPVRLHLFGEVDCTVDWGDGSSAERVTAIHPEHIYETPGTYYVAVKGKVTALNGQPLTHSYRNLLMRVLRWGRTGLKSMNYAVAMSNHIKSIATDNAGSFAEVTTFDNAFANCFELESIPAGLFEYAVEATEFYMCFAACYQIKEIPAGLFAKCVKAESMLYAFGQMEKLQTIPGDMLSGCTALTSVKQLFDTARKPPVSSIPGTLFAGCPNLTNVESAFSGLVNVKTLDANLFANNPKIESFSSIFWECGITSVPKDLFKNNVNAKNMNSIFYDNPLSSIPAGLFDGQVVADNFSSTFRYCPIESIPAGLLDNCVMAKTFNSTFRDTKVTAIPAGLFDSCVDATDFSHAFRDTPIVSMPTGLFDNCRKVTNFGYTFRNCTELTGESPYTMIGTEKVYLHQRVDYPDEFAKPTTFSYCFGGCTGLSDYNDIPTTWGGGKQ